MRGRRPWSDLRDEILRLLREQEGEYFSNQQLLDLFNQEKDLREMEMMQAHEGFSVQSYNADLVANQDYYSLPTGAGRLKRVVRVMTNPNQEIPLVRDERVSEPLDTNRVATGVQYVPTYRLIGNLIKLEPGPATSEAGGLRIEMEEASELLTQDDSTIPDDWPVFAETLLVLDTVVAAYEMERAQAVVDRDRVALDPYVRRRARFESLWNDWIEERSFGRTYVVPFRQGG